MTTTNNTLSEETGQSLINCKICGLTLMDIRVLEIFKRNKKFYGDWSYCKCEEKER
jgi:hypothetical protein